MTESEAKKFMLIEKECINRDCDRDCANCDIVQKVEDLNNAYDMAIKTLEKQIPKKPEYEADGYADGELVYDYAKCPICGHDFEYGINDWGCEYCSDCGQKLDWSDEE